MRDWKHVVRGRLAEAKLDGIREAEIVDELAQHLEDRYQLCGWLVLPTRKLNGSRSKN